MAARKILSGILLGYLLGILETSMLPQAAWLHRVPLVTSLVIFAVLLWEYPRSTFSMTAIAAAGFFIDIFSRAILGTWSLMLLIGACFVLFVLDSYVRIPIVSKTP